MIFPNKNKIVLESFNDVEGSWFPRLASILNSLIVGLTSMFDKNLTVTDNLDGQINTVILDGTWPVKFAWSRRAAPSAIIVGKLSRVDGQATNLAAAYSIDWSYANGVVSLADTPGLTPSSTNKYYLTLVGLVK